MLCCADLIRELLQVVSTDGMTLEVHRSPADHASHFADSFALLDQFRRDHFLCDVTICVEGRSFACHRVVLSATIPYFRSMFASDMIESRLDVVVIKDLTADAFDALLTYAYTGRVQVRKERAQELLFAALILQMDDVKADCERFLVRFLSSSNCLSIRSFAVQHNCPELIRSVDRFALSNFRDLRRTPDFLAISSQHLVELISDSNLNVASEADVFEAVIAWVEHDPDRRLKLLPLLLGHVRLTQLPLPYLVQCVSRNPLIKADQFCTELVNRTFVRVLVQCRLLHPSSENVDEEVCRPRKSAAGVLFCVGGRGSNGDPFRSAEVYDWLNNVWFAVNEMNTKRRHVGVVAANGKVFAIGGHNGTDHLNSVEMFDPQSNRWFEKSPMKYKRRGIALGYLEGAVYSVGGLDDTSCFHMVERYDIEYDLWTSVACMNVQRGGVGVAVLGKFLYAVGGNDGTTSLKSCERYDPYVNRWAMVAEMNFRRAGAGVAVLNGFIYAIGGFDDSAPLSSCERYSPSEDVWMPLPPMSCPRGGVGAAAMGGRLYAIGGHDGYHYLSSVEVFDPLSSTWNPVAPICECRAGAGVTMCDCLAAELYPAKAVSVAGCV